jgi:hypothetical protein
MYLDVQVENKDEGEDRHPLVIVGPGHRAGDVGGHNRHEGSCCQASTLPPDLFHEQVGGKRAEGGEQGCGENTNLR